MYYALIHSVLIHSVNESLFVPGCVLVTAEKKTVTCWTFKNKVWGGRKAANNYAATSPVLE